MSELKCLFCQKELHKDSDGYYTCYTDNCGCMKCGGNGASGSESLWLTLIHTRKALDTATDTLCWYDNNYDSVVARNTLDEIKQITETKE